MEETATRKLEMVVRLHRCLQHALKTLDLSNGKKSCTTVMMIIFALAIDIII